VTLKGIILSCNKPEAEEKIEDWAPTDLIQSLTQLPVLGILPYLSSEQLKDLDYLANIATKLNWEKLGLEPIKLK
jgi:dethiobiotin synthetase